jgi:hypothetical protein
MASGEGDNPCRARETAGRAGGASPSCVRSVLAIITPTRASTICDARAFAIGT